MWKYVQSTGQLYNPQGTKQETGYSGRGDAKNDPSKQCVKDTGPIPRGYYDIGEAQTHPKLGPVAIPLQPDPGNDMCGRDDFWFHGDSVADPGSASRGCIIMTRKTREKVDENDDKRLRVVSTSKLTKRRPKAKRNRKSIVIKKKR